MAGDPRKPQLRSFELTVDHGAVPPDMGPMFARYGVLPIFAELGSEHGRSKLVLEKRINAAAGLHFGVDLPVEDVGFEGCGRKD